MYIPLMTCNKNQICVDTTNIFSPTQKFATREETTRWNREVGIMNNVSVIITCSDTKIGKKGRSNKVIFGCEKGGKYKEKDIVTQSTTKNVAVHSKLGQHRQKMVLDGRSIKNVDFLTMVYLIDFKVIRL